jgi:hypothetical protein
MYRTQRRFLAAGLTVGILFAAAPAFAQLVPSGCLEAADLSTCGLKELLSTFQIVGNFLFGIAGSLAFLMFIYGGFVWLTSAGKAEDIKKGQTIVWNAIIGLVIIFSSRALIGFVQQALTKGSSVAIEGGACTGDSPTQGVQGRWKQVQDEMVCIDSCEKLAQATTLPFACGAPNPGATCEPGLCPGGNDNVCCVKDTGYNTCTCEMPAAGNFNVSINKGSACKDLNCTYNNKTCTCAGTSFTFDPALGISEEQFKLSCAAAVCSPEDIYATP